MVLSFVVPLVDIILEQVVVDAQLIVHHVVKNAEAIHGGRASRNS